MSHRERERERILREQQDRAFQDSAQKDLQRIALKMESERQQMAERQRKLDEARIEEERKRRDKENEAKHFADRMKWRRWSRHTLLFQDTQSSSRALRIAVRLPEGKRIIHHFSSTSTLTTLYAFVDVQLLPPDLLSDDDPRTPPNGILTGEAALDHQILSFHGKEEWWGFKLVLAYPRQEIRWEIGRMLSDIEGLTSGSQVMVEITDRRRVRQLTEEDETSDGYSSEESRGE